MINGAVDLDCGYLPSASLLNRIITYVALRSSFTFAGSTDQNFLCSPRRPCPMVSKQSLKAPSVMVLAYQLNEDIVRLKVASEQFELDYLIAVFAEHFMDIDIQHGTVVGQRDVEFY